MLSVMNRQPPNQELNVDPDWNENDPKPEGEIPEDGMRTMPTDPPAVVPAMSSEQFGVAAGIGLAGFAKQNPEGGLTGDPEEPWVRDLAADEEPVDER
jgi:hypothetical protein